VSIYHGRKLGALLIEAGIVPTNARLLELVVPADGAIILRYEVFLDTDAMGTFGRVLQQLAADRKEPVE
jgi:hypothetical protein